MKSTLVAYIACALALGAVGLFSYHPWFSSACWYWAYGAFPDEQGVIHNNGGWLEALRLALLVLFFAFAQIALFRGQIDRFNEGQGRWVTRVRHAFFNATWRPLRILTTLAIPLLVVYHIVIGPLQLYHSLPHSPESLLTAPSMLFHQIVRPYLLYFFYSFATYIMIALPMYIGIANTLAIDRSELRTRKARIETEAVREPDHLGIELIEADILSARHAMAGMANRYLAMALLVIVYFAVEIGTPMIQTLACWAQETIKWALWIFLILLLPYFLVESYQLYSSIYERSIESLKRIGAKAEATKNVAVLSTVNVRIEKLEGRAWLSFAKQLATTMALGAALMLALVSFGVHKFATDPAVREKAAQIALDVCPSPVDVTVLRIAHLLQNGRSPAGAENKEIHCECIRRREDPSTLPYGPTKKTIDQWLGVQK